MKARVGPIRERNRSECRTGGSDRTTLWSLTRAAQHSCVDAAPTHYTEKYAVTYHRESAASRDAGITYHLVPAPVWEAGKSGEWYTPEAYAADGFIHCTNGLNQLVTVANMFYVSDAREFRALVLDTGKIESELRYDDDAETFPHIYGPLNTSAVVDELTVKRAEDGSFLSIKR